MDKFYYLVSQMPGLVFDRPAGVDVKKFLLEAQKWLNKRDLRALGRIGLFSIDKSGKHPRVYREYQEFEVRLRTQLARWRKGPASGEETGISSSLLSLVKEGNPLEVEKKLLKLRWDFIDEKMTDHHFDLGFLILYLLKLQILKKLAEFDKEKGLAAYRQAVAVDVESYLSEQPAAEEPAE